MNKLEILKKEINNIKFKVNIDKKIIEIQKNYSYTEDQEVNMFLNTKANELLNIIGNGNLYLGKIFDEVKEYCDTRKIDATFCEWLQLNGFNRMTALRYRNRYSIYKNLSSKDAKELIALCPQRIIDKLIKIEDDSLVNKLDSAFNLEDLENIVSDYFIEDISKQEISKTTQQSLSLFKNITKEIDNNNLSKAKEDVKNLKNLIREIEDKISQQEEINSNNQNLKIFH